MGPMSTSMDSDTTRRNVTKNNQSGKKTITRISPIVQQQCPARPQVASPEQAVESHSKALALVEKAVVRASKKRNLEESTSDSNGERRALASVNITPNGIQESSDSKAIELFRRSWPTVKELRPNWPQDGNDFKGSMECDDVQQAPVDILILLETHVQEPRMSRFWQSLGPDLNGYGIPGTGHSGGIIACWRSSVGRVSALTSDQQLMHLVVQVPNEDRGYWWSYMLVLNLEDGYKYGGNHLKSYKLDCQL
ncbi:hypothetical protein QJS10_CPB11g00687 [Acorus calamus]|uniref:Uncharacterized protein n=1 Tax=Acorus calamus TaxID=4465 RepID=A0AAV9DSP4_ACOCL|nr:hypothetical protein QJS10_CPB11g00687 [Acorus calamus]